MDGTFKKALVTSPSHVAITVSEWGDFTQAYAKYQVDCQSKAQCLITDEDFEKRAVVSDIISPFFHEWKKYWSQFGFLNNASCESLCKTIESCVMVKPIQEDSMSNSENNNVFANEGDDMI
jgi:hypothetical protein